MMLERNGTGVACHGMESNRFVMTSGAVPEVEQIGWGVYVYVQIIRIRIPGEGGGPRCHP